MNGRRNERVQKRFNMKNKTKIKIYQYRMGILMYAHRKDYEEEEEKRDTCK